MTDAAAHAVFEIVGEHIARITINRPHRLGAYTPRMCAEILEGLRRVRLDDAIRVLILTGSGRGFCSGGDLSPDAGFDEALGHQLGRARELREDSHAVVTALHRLDKPVICAVNGLAVNGGLAFALSCDIRIVAAGARLGDTSARAGLLPDEGGAWLYPRIMGYDRAFRMVAFSEIYDADTAQALGLATEVVADAELASRAVDLAEKLAAGPPLALRAVKFMMRRALENTLETSLGDAEQAVLWVGPSADAQEGKEAFLERRPPKFTGR
ncbi:enoyl-CoA hydratase/isomerase family protein [Mycobacterium branderi]|uniref:Enoyl-CoA hydratase n=1 Tax=Mycobacterium branderi TaxID=43348 RepID=A0A7I7WG47_9MYCO|nr:enoyl-CoA hydratase-related protein [Mycobacterium branderi]MCV7231578.1 enoyl-CoA hydratase/isomerase family protein [Mycobacterium branderi]ORA40425.1 enoyl-CoA hydratase [Mycobacterium branderi]BBZ14938.1 enoyl-CoA hydratase [Mycobacterium branderi]